MPYNSLSINNLNRKGGTVGRKKPATMELAKTMVDLLTDNHALFIQQMSELSPKDYCDVYIRLMKMVLPTKLILDTVTPTAIPVWTITPASTVTPSSAE
jgi:hypothetical protein